MTQFALICVMLAHACMASTFLMLCMAQVKAVHCSIESNDCIPVHSRCGTMCGMGMCTAWFSPRQMASWWRCLYQVDQAPKAPLPAQAKHAGGSSMSYLKQSGLLRSGHWHVVFSCGAGVSFLEQFDAISLMTQLSLFVHALSLLQ